MCSRLVIFPCWIWKWLDFYVALCDWIWLDPLLVTSVHPVQLWRFWLTKFNFAGSNAVYSKLDWETRLRIALEAARGLEYLHEHINPPVIHRDFKSSNILLDKNLHAKVSDFGLAKLGSEKAGGHVSTRVLGTQGYVAPEYESSWWF